MYAFYTLPLSLARLVKYWRGRLRTKFVFSFSILLNPDNKNLKLIWHLTLLCCKENACKNLINTFHNCAEEENVIEETGEIAATCHMCDMTGRTKAVRGMQLLLLTITKYNGGCSIRGSIDKSRKERRYWWGEWRKRKSRKRRRWG